MAIHLSRAVFALLWIALGLAFLTKQTWLAPDLFETRSPANLQLLGIVAIAFGIYHLVRLYRTYCLSTRRNSNNTLRDELTSRRKAAEVPLPPTAPELDFTHSPPAAPPQ